MDDNPHRTRKHRLPVRRRPVFGEFTVTPDGEYDTTCATGRSGVPARYTANR